VLPALFALVLAPLLASPFDLNAGVLTEARGGKSPVLAGKDPEWFAAAVLTPQVEASLRDERVEAQLAYLPRFFWQVPNNAGFKTRTLILHQLSFRIFGRPTSTTDANAHAFASYGQPDYSILSYLLPTGQTALPQVQTIVTASGGFGVEQSLSRRLHLTLAGDAVYFRVIDEVPIQNATGMASTLPRQTSFDATPGVVYSVTRNDDFLLTSTVAYGQYANDTAIVTVTPLLTWRNRQPAGDGLRLSIGLSYAQDVGTTHIISSGSALLPTATGDVLHGLLVQDGYGLLAHLRVTAEQYVDPILLSTGPRFMASGQLSLTAAPDWSVALQGDFSASLAKLPPPPPGTGPPPGAPPNPDARPPDQTAFSVRVPARHRFSRNCVLEFGGLYGDRGPSLTSSDFKFHQRQLWAYFALTITTRDVPTLSIR
jgi:hypothetical protein